MFIQVQCAICGKIEAVPEHRAKKYKTCSIECRSKLAAQNLTQKIKTNCVVCGTELELKPFRLKRVKHGITCSKECFAQRQKEVMAGERNHQHGLKGPLNASYKEGLRIVINNGQPYYKKYAPNHPRANQEGRFWEHILVAEENKLGPSEAYDEKGYIKKGWHVHHKNEDTLDNSVDNLEVLTHGQHVSEHNSRREIVRCENTGRILTIVRS